MSLRKALRRTPTIALLVGLPMLGLAAYEPGCAKSLLDGPPPGQGSSSQSGSSSSSSNGTSSNSSNGLSSSSGSSGSSVSNANQPINATGLAIYQLSCSSTSPTVGESPLRRISRVEYDDMVRDLLGDTTQPATGFVSETPLAMGINFETNTYTTVTDTTIPQQYLEAAETLAQTAVTSTNFNNWLTTYASSCSGNQQTSACAQQFIDAFAGAAFRGQYDSDESSQLMTLFTSASTQLNSFSAGIQAVIVSVLTSPYFLYVVEYGQSTASSGAVPLKPNELATRLALFLWRSIPDQTLTNDASSGKLSTASGMAAEVQRMLQDPKAKTALADFTTQWMELQNTPSATKDTQFTMPAAGRLPWTATLANDMVSETTSTVYNEVVTENGGAGGTLNELLTSNQSYINGDLAQFYGVGGADAGSASFSSKMNVNPSGLNIRAGILTNGSVMATQAHTSLPSPVLRGKLVREEVLCDPVQDPPAEVAGAPIGPPPSTVAAGETVNEEFAAHITNPECSDCHNFMDPIGFGFANFDATGAYQATDSNGFTDGGPYPAIDAGGSVVQFNDGEFQLASFYGPVDLVTQLATAPQIQQCYVLEQFRYALGRVEQPADTCSVQGILQSFSQQNFNLQQALVAVAQSTAFQYRNAETPGSDCQ